MGRSGRKVSKSMKVQQLHSMIVLSVGICTGVDVSSCSFLNYILMAEIDDNLIPILEIEAKLSKLKFGVFGYQVSFLRLHKGDYSIGVCFHRGVLS